MTALLGGHVMIASTASSGYAPHVKAGTVRLLVTYGEERMEQSPDVPTIKEVGYPSLVIQSWYATYGPKNMETSIVNKLADAFGKAMMTPEFKKVADQLEIYTKKPLFGQELTKAFSKHYKDNGELYRKVGLIK